MNPVKILVAQGGGPTAVINQSLVGAVLEARRFARVERVYGARHGVRGIVNEDLVDLSEETAANLEQVALSATLVCIVAIGEALVIIARQVDLSVGAMVAMSAFVSASWLEQNPEGSIFVVLIIGCAVGLALVRPDEQTAPERQTVQQVKAAHPLTHTQFGSTNQRVGW